MKKTTPKSDRPTSVTTTLEIVNTRRRKKSSGIIGFSMRDSQTTNTAMSAAAATRNETMNGDVKECDVVSMRPNVRQKSPAVMSTVPTTSSVVADGSLDSSTAKSVTAPAITPIGTLIQK